MSETQKPSTPPAPTRRTSVSITKVKSLQELFEHPELKSRMEKLVPAHLNADRMLRTFTGSVLKTPGLAKASPLSMLGCAMTIAYLGLEPNTPLGLMYLIPFDVKAYNRSTRQWDYVRTDVTPIVGYEGFIDLIARGGMCKDLDCQVIWPGDVWENERGSDRHFKHIQKFAPQKPGAEPDFAYMFARTLNGGQYVEMMSREQIHQTRALSQGYQTAMRAYESAIKEGKKPGKAYTEAPWIKHSIAMWRKTPLRVGQKWIPGRTPEMAMAARMDELGDSNRVRFDKVLDVEQVIEGSWEATDEEMDLGDQPEPTEPTRTQVQGAAVGTEADKPKPEPEPRQTRKAAPKKAAAAPAPADDEPPDDRWPPSDGEGQPTSAAAGVGTTAAVSPETATQKESPAVSGAPDFDTLLLDANGEPVGDPITDPLYFAQRLGNYLKANAEHWDNILAENADGIDMVRGTKDMAAINVLESVINPPEAEVQHDDPEAQDDGPPGAIVVEMKMDRGSPMEQQYFADFSKEVQGLVRANLMDFIELNRDNMLRVRKSYSTLLVKALDAKAKELGMPLTPEVRAGLLVTTPTRTTPVETKPAAAPSVDPDIKVAADRIADINQCTSLADLDRLNRGPVISGFAERMKREGKTDLLGRVQQAFLAKKAQLGGNAA